MTFYSHFFFGCYRVLKDYVRERRGKKKKEKSLQRSMNERVTNLGRTEDIAAIFCEQNDDDQADLEVRTCLLVINW